MMLFKLVKQKAQEVANQVLNLCDNVKSTDLVKQGKFAE